jgi:predicted lactoylglutathione lyase
LGVEPENFWGFIPSEFAIFVKGKYKSIKDHEEREQRRTALLSAMIANFSGHSKKRYKVDDFMPKPKATGKDMLKEVQKLNALFGGEVRRK